MQVKIFEATMCSDTCKTNKLQIKLANSFYAKVLAVKKVAKDNHGRKTAGIDGVKNLSEDEMFEMASTLTINHKPSPVRRKLIPKPGKKEKRPLGIPCMKDRAQQALIALTLAPQWEARYSEQMFGFRKGRGAQDALAYTRICLLNAPRWILDADIERFFDLLNHEELLNRIDAPQSIKDAIKRILKAGHMAEKVIYRSEHGTPQGGPLSSILANIAMTRLIPYVEARHRAQYQSKPPIIIIYADDMVVIHPDRDVIAHTKESIDSYLHQLGLRLSPSKTRICHTRDKDPDTKTRGFDFLGAHFQHVLTDDKKGGKRPYLLATPSRDDIKHIYKKCCQRIDRSIINRKRQGKRRYNMSKGKRDPVTKMIRDLNLILNGWSQYHSVINAKETFSKVDNLIFNKLLKWSKRQFKSKTADWRYQRMFSGIETDKDGNPLLRQDGEPRERNWAFKSPFVANEKDHVTLIKIADRRVSTHTMTRLTSRYYDNDWLYWGSKQNNYPGIPDTIYASALRRSGAKCSLCKSRFSKGDKVKEVTAKDTSLLVHCTCPH